MKFIYPSRGTNGTRQTGGLWRHLLPSLQRLLVGGAFGIAAGISLGVLIGFFSYVRAGLVPLVEFAPVVGPDMALLLAVSPVEGVASTTSLAPDAEETWTSHVHDTGARLLLTKVDSWMTGVNKNVAGRQKRTFMAYAGGAPKYRQKCEEIAANGYEGFKLSS